MLSKKQYVWKAKNQRGLSDEQIQYFLDRDTRYDLMLRCKTAVRQIKSLRENRRFLFYLVK